jgi:hypothetical protein
MLHSESQHLEQGGIVSWLSRDELPDWDRFAARHPLAKAYHLAGWGHFLEKIFPHIQSNFLVLRDRNTSEIKAGIPLYTARSPLLGNRLLSIPFATLCDPLVASLEEFQCLWPHVLEFYRRSKMNRVEFKTTQSSLTSPGGLTQVAEYLHHFIKLFGPPEKLKGEFSKTIRRAISKAEKSGVEVKEDNSGESLERFSSLHAQGRRKLRLPVLPRDFFSAMHGQLPSNVVSVLVATRQGEHLSSLLTLEFGDWVIFEYLADTDQGREVGANHLLYWTSAERAIRAGRHFASFGRTALTDAGLLQFKRSWNSIEEPLVTLRFPPVASPGKALWVTPAIRRMVKLSFGIMPERVGRIVGNFCYRHWA